MASTLTSHNPFSIPVVAIVIDSSIALAGEWHHILNVYFPHLFGRLAGGAPSSLAHLGFVTYGPRDCNGSPVFVNRFFARNALNELMEGRTKLAIGRTVTGSSTGMAALEGYAAAIEMFDTFKHGINQNDLNTIGLNESRDKPKEEVSYHLWHFAAEQPDDAEHPLWHSSPTLDNLTWTTVPTELKKRDINCSMLLFCPSPKFSELFSAISDMPVTPWFPTRPHHTVLLSGFAPSTKPKAAVPSIIPTKHPAETPAEQRSPGPKVAKPSQTASQCIAMMQASSQPQAFPEQEQSQPGFPAGGIPGGTPQQQLASLPQQPPASINNPMLQRVIQGQDPSQARQFSMLLAQGQQQQQQQQQQNSSGFASRAGQSLNPPGVGLPQGQASLQQSFVQPSPSVPPANVQSSSTPSASQAPPPGGQQVPVPGNFTDLSLPQLRVLHAQLFRFVIEGEKSLQASSTTGGENDIQRQQLRAKIELYKQRILALQEMMKTRPSGGDPAQQTVNGPSWTGQGQRPTGLYSGPERPGQHSSPSLHQPPVNQVPPPRSIPTPQQNFVPSTIAQPNLTQIPSHVPANGLPHNGALGQVAGAPPQQNLLFHKIPPLPEERFKGVFQQFTAATGVRLSERDLVVEGRPINLWALHRAVFLRKGFDSVNANDEWPIIGAALGFPLFPSGDGGQPRCGPAIAHRLQQLYTEVLRHFDQAYINNVVARMRKNPPLPITLTISVG